MFRKFLIFLMVPVLFSACSFNLKVNDEGVDIGAGSDGNGIDIDIDDDAGSDDDGSGDVSDGDVMPDLGGEKTLAMVDDMEILILESFPVQVNVIVKGNLRNGCERIKEVMAKGYDEFYITITTEEEGDICTQALTPFEETVSLDVEGLQKGVYEVSVNQMIFDTFELQQDNFVRDYEETDVEGTYLYERMDEFNEISHAACTRIVDKEGFPMWGTDLDTLKNDFSREQILNYTNNPAYSENFYNDVIKELESGTPETLDIICKAGGDYYAVFMIGQDTAIIGRWLKDGGFYLSDPFGGLFDMYYVFSPYAMDSGHLFRDGYGDAGVYWYRYHLVNFETLESEIIEDCTLRYEMVDEPAEQPVIDCGVKYQPE